MAVHGMRGVAYADGERRLLGVLAKTFLDTGSHLPGHCLVGFDEQQGELVAAVPRCLIGGPAVLPEDLGEANQGVIADEMTVQVVDALEPVEIE